MSLFDINELNKKTESTREQSGSELLRERFLQIHNARVESIKNLCGNFPSGSEIFFIWTLNSFNAFTFIPYIIKHVGIIDELIVSTYSINQRIIDAFINLIEKKKIAKAFIFISESIQHRQPKVFDYLNHTAKNYPEVIKIGYAWNHSKVTLIKSAGNHFVIEGSGNWSENSKHEQYIFLNSQKVYEFRAEWITNKINRESASGS